MRNGKCREASRESSHARLSKYHGDIGLPIPIQGPTPSKSGQRDHAASAQNGICLFLCNEQFIFQFLSAPTSLVMSSQTKERTPGISQQDKGPWAARLTVKHLHPAPSPLPARHPEAQSQQQSRGRPCGSCWS